MLFEIATLIALSDGNVSKIEESLIRGLPAQIAVKSGKDDLQGIESSETQQLNQACSLIRLVMGLSFDDEILRNLLV